MLKWWRRQRGGSAGSTAREIHARTSPRYRRGDVTSSLGLVVDMSSTGMQVESDRGVALTVGAEALLTLQSRRSQELRVHGRVVWVRRRGRGRSSAGVEFVRVGDATRRQLESLAQFGLFDERDRRSGTEEPAQAAPVRAAVVDLYAMLGVEASADAATIKARYRELVKQLHPDARIAAGLDAPDAGSDRAFDELSKAYRILSDEDLRAKYDAMVPTRAA